MKPGIGLAALANEVERQAKAKKDIIAPTKLLRVNAHAQNHAEQRITMDILKGNGGKEAFTFPINRTAHEDLSTLTKVPKPYYDRMLNEAPGLLAENLNTWLAGMEGRRMVRTLDGNARAVMSDRYKRRDYIDVVRYLMPPLAEANAQVVSCELTERRMYIKAVMVETQAKLRIAKGHNKLNELICAGVMIRTSEIGESKVEIAPFADVMVCTNLLIVSKYAFGQIHIGRKIETGRDVEELLTDETMALEDEVFWRKMVDVLNATISPEIFGKMVKSFQESAGFVLDNPVEAVDEIVELNALTDDDRSGILAHLTKGGDLSTWGLSMAITRHAADVDDYDKSTELEILGGEIVTAAA